MVTRFETCPSGGGDLLLGGKTGTILKQISWLVSERILNRGSEPLLRPKNGIVKIYGPSVYCEVCFNMVAILYDVGKTTMAHD